MSELPKGWSKVCIADVVDKPKQNKPEADENIIYVDIGSINREKKVIENPQQLLGADAPSRARKRINTDDVLVSLTRPNLNAVAIVPEYLDQQYASTGFDVLKPNSIHPKFLFYLVRTRKFIDAISGKVQGALYPAAKSSDVQSFEFHAPNLEEQKRIADKLDSVLAKVEAAQARLDKIPTILKRFRQSVLAAATSGELTKEWREKGNSSSLSKSEILAYHRKAWEQEKFAEFSLKQKMPKNDKWKDNYKLPYEPTEEDKQLFSKWPSVWSFVSVDQITKFVKDGPHYSPQYTEEGIPFISGRNISEHGIDFSTCKYISRELHEEISKRCKPLKGDVLYTKGGTTGIACENDLEQEFNVWVHVAVLRVTHESLISPGYLKLALNSPICYQRSQFYTHGVANRDLGLKRMIKICFPLPPKDEQIEVIKRVDELSRYASAIEKQYSAAKARLDKLSQSILARAFKGELLLNSVDSKIKSIESSIEALNA